MKYKKLVPIWVYRLVLPSLFFLFSATSCPDQYKILLQQTAYTLVPEIPVNHKEQNRFTFRAQIPKLKVLARIDSIKFKIGYSDSDSAVYFDSIIITNPALLLSSSTNWISKEIVLPELPDADSLQIVAKQSIYRGGISRTTDPINIKRGNNGISN